MFRLNIRLKNVTNQMIGNIPRDEDERITASLSPRQRRWIRNWNDLDQNLKRAAHKILEWEWGKNGWGFEKKRAIVQR